MVADTTVRNVALGITFIFLWSRNSKIGMAYSYLLFAISEFGELRGGGSFLVDNPLLIESTERKMRILRLENM